MTSLSPSSRPNGLLSRKVTSDSHADLVLGLSVSSGGGSRIVDVFPGNGDRAFGAVKKTASPISSTETEAEGRLWLNDG